MRHVGRPHALRDRAGGALEAGVGDDLEFDVGQAVAERQAGHEDVLQLADQLDAAVADQADILPGVVKTLLISCVCWISALEVSSSNSET